MWCNHLPLLGHRGLTEILTEIGPGEVFSAAVAVWGGDPAWAAWLYVEDWQGEEVPMAAKE